ncbi:hypothetical protein WJX72_002788 [[Myrmecia] bisecta]|uniref:Uncharacterized protein n=1 Tax=[Myrmecia] bisecta TaxID=41462 RepID=A0AAW1Q9R1_9CHLO
MRLAGGLPPGGKAAAAFCMQSGANTAIVPRDSYQTVCLFCNPPWPPQRRATIMNVFWLKASNAKLAAENAALKSASAKASPSDTATPGDAFTTLIARAPATAQPPNKKRKLTAEEKEAAKQASKQQRAKETTFKKDAGECIKESIQWNGSCGIGFTIAVERDVFDNVLGSVGQQYLAYKKGAPAGTSTPLSLVQMDTEAAFQAFGKTRCQKSFRYSGSGCVTWLTVVYDGQYAEFSGSWRMGF